MPGTVVHEPKAVLLAATMLAFLHPLGCALHGRPVDFAPPDLAELVEAHPDIAKRDLFYGVGGPENAPPKGPFRFLEKDKTGWSPGYEVEDPSGRVWDVKLGSEVKPEVAVSRLVWAIGFHQPPTYYVREWTLLGGPDPGLQPEARFRPKLPSMKRKGSWAWQDNPFVGTRELRGLFVMMVLVNNWDLKTSNNVNYYKRDGPAPRRLYVVRDLGESLGGSVGMFRGTRNNPKDFEREGFIRNVRGDEVQFHYNVLVVNWGIERGVTVDDVLWTCRRLARLSDRQWKDAFRAAGYADAEAASFIGRLQQKMREGLALERSVKAPSPGSQSSRQSQNLPLQHR